MGRSPRIFGESLKRELVSRYEKGEITIKDICRTYDIVDKLARDWVKKYGNPELRGVRIVVEKESAEMKVRELEKQLKDREAALGDMVMQLRYLKQENTELAKLVSSDQKKSHDASN